MKVLATETAAGLVLRLEGEFTIAESAELTSTLKEHLLHSSVSFILDLGGVEAADVTFFQILIAFRKSLGLQDRKLYKNELAPEHYVQEAALKLGFVLDSFFALRRLEP